MDYFQTVGGQRFAGVLQSALPQIAENLGRLADAMEARNRLLEARAASADDAVLGIPPKYANLDEIERERRERSQSHELADIINRSRRGGVRG